MPFTEDTGVFFDTVNGFADKATVGGTPVDGIFNEGFQEALGVETTGPSLTCKTECLPASAGEDSVVIVCGKTFKVSEIHPGAGVSTLMLYQD